VSSREQRPQPGVSRGLRISDEGLQRLQRQLTSGATPSRPVLQQWVKRYGDDALALLKAHGIDITGDSSD